MRKPWSVIWAVLMIAATITRVGAVEPPNMAPVIFNFNSPVVGNEPDLPNKTPFVYPDAFDITSKACDDTTDPAHLRWSYIFFGDPVYRINNVDPVALKVSEINNPGAKQINGATLDPADIDGRAATITIRNVKYAPLSGTGSTPATGGIIDPRVMTLFSSDGTTFSSHDVIFYTDNGGNDRLSGERTPRPTPPIPLLSQWNYEYLTGSVTSSTSGGTALCLESSLKSNDFASWRSPWGLIGVAKNTVYHVRAKINGNQTGGTTTPFFDLVFDNYDASKAKGLNLYGGDFMVLDNEGGANAPRSTSSGMIYHFYWTPACVGTAAFNASNYALWSEANAEGRKCEMTFRVLDVNANTGITADNDAGAICLTALTIEAFPYDQMQLAPEPVYQNNYLTPNNWFEGGGGKLAVLGDDLTFKFENGVYTITPVNNGVDHPNPAKPSETIRGAAYTQACPGDGIKTYTAAGSGSLVDDYPIVWAPNTLYLAKFKLAAPDTNSEANPFDIFWFGMDAATNELISVSYVTNKVGLCATPKTGTPQEYAAFFYSHNVTFSPLGANAQRLRPRCDFANVPFMIDGNGSGKIAIHGVTVNKVMIPE